MSGFELEDKVKIFQDWLQKHGARFPKLSWPREDTPSGIRGTIAEADIATDEVMVEIPMKLMMCPPLIFQDEQMGNAFKSSLDLLQGDLLLAVYIAHELRKGASSFYKPYLDILPEPDCISQWKDSELLWLQDEKLLLRAKNRRFFLKRMYNRTILALNLRFPELFPLEEFSLSAFTFSWNTIQARAFGRRLPWTALVPFSDCLNHSNVQTKYDFDVGGNQVFRLFPTGNNAYAKGSEVFNSYGRRSNENLLLDYGFAMEGNEWDEVEIQFCANYDEEYFSTRSRILHLLGLASAQVFHVASCRIPFATMTFLRVICCSGTVLLEEMDRIDQIVAEANPNENIRSTLKQEISFTKPCNSDLEVECLKYLCNHLQKLLNGMGSTIDEDLHILKQIREGVPIDCILKGLNQAEQNRLLKHQERSDSDVEDGNSLKMEFTSSDRIVNAVVYRLTRKSILMAAIDNLTTLSTSILSSAPENKIYLEDKFLWENQPTGHSYNHDLIVYLSTLFD